nr:hypothetical protein BaRGS_026778 [Batillaria attramentaria]
MATRAEGSYSQFQFVVNTFLEVLDLAWNGFGGDGTIALGQALMVNTYIRVLDLTNNRIDKPTAIKFGEFSEEKLRS